MSKYVKMIDPHTVPEWDALKTPLEKAEMIGNTPGMLKWRLHECWDVLRKDLRKTPVYDLPAKRCYVDKIVLVFQVREHPDQPTSYENQQTSLGDVLVFWRKNEAG